MSSKMRIRICVIRKKLLIFPVSAQISHLFGEWSFGLCELSHYDALLRNVDARGTRPKHYVQWLPRAARQRVPKVFLQREGWYESRLQIRDPPRATSHPSLRRECWGDYGKLCALSHHIKHRVGEHRTHNLYGCKMWWRESLLGLSSRCGTRQNEFDFFHSWSWGATSPISRTQLVAEDAEISVGCKMAQQTG